MAKGSALSPAPPMIHEPGSSGCSSLTLPVDSGSSQVTVTHHEGSDLEKGRPPPNSDPSIDGDVPPALQEASTNEINKNEIEVTLDGNEDPLNWSRLRKWLIVFAVCTGGFCVTCTSSVGSYTYGGLESTFGISEEVAILTVSLYIEGLGVGPLLLGPLSEFFGRNNVYLISFTFFLLLNFPVAFANSAGLHLTFRFITGFSGAAFMSVAGGTVSDLFLPREVGYPMAVYTASPFLGPVVGPIIAGFINQNTNWRWTYYIFLIWALVEIIMMIVLAPETYRPVLLKRKAARLRKQTGDNRYYAPMDKIKRSLMRSVIVSCYTPFKILFHEPMALLLNIWTALLLGILYLFFEAFPIVFRNGHGFSLQESGLTFIGLGIGIILGPCTQFMWWGRIDQRMWEKYGGPPPPETRLFMGMAGALTVPIGMFWFAFTTYPTVHWMVPILASIPFALGMMWVYISVFTFLVTSFRPVAASALASNSFLRSAFGAIFPLFSTYMYASLGTVGASALLAGLTVLMAPLPFIFYKIGPQLRKRSRFSQERKMDDAECSRTDA
ncbi:MFS general substrate transporter [Dacryopinax primogenitus]|uniref:MFS general substrate transporter n=1 Tax=Dacryopinax primogenitus (strain DJM 731) TaxID=1858805 RepID=M5G0W7_DACPD|nr:MFS general substrate transporter [Dacryopinax primogenitus]EJU01785.1 MFS general substrate transporter [Dacryopinax primogenitus]